MRRRNGKHFLIFVQFSGFQKPWRVGADGGEGPPVPIPNTAVKLISADNTWLEAAREDRQAPTQEKRRAYHGSDTLFFIRTGCHFRDILSFFCTYCLYFSSVPSLSFFYFREGVEERNR